MSKTTTTICDQCHNDINKEVSWPPVFNQCWTVKFVSETSGYLNQEMHFCTFDHMMDYLKEAHTRQDEVPKDE